MPHRGAPSGVLPAGGNSALLPPHGEQPAGIAPGLGRRGPAASEPFSGSNGKGPSLPAEAASEALLDLVVAAAQLPPTSPPTAEGSHEGLAPMQQKARPQRNDLILEGNTS
eukprot:2771834-Alexandrium_andersonii.AAC.1